MFLHVVCQTVMEPEPRSLGCAMASPAVRPDRFRVFEPLNPLKGISKAGRKFDAAQMSACMLGCTPPYSSPLYIFSHIRPWLRVLCLGVTQWSAPKCTCLRRFGRSFHRHSEEILKLRPSFVNPQPKSWVAVGELKVICHGYIVKTKV